MIAHDSLRSLITGLGDPLRDKAASMTYGHTVLGDDQLMLSYRNSWIARKVVDVPALDALRKGRDWQAEQEQITLLEMEEKRLGLWNKLLQCKTLARLWGGAAIYIGTKDQDLSEPLDVEKLGKAGLTYLTVLSRREVVPHDLERDPLSEFFGLPSRYQVSGSSEFVDIHPSRLMVQIGSPHPDPWNATGNSHGWGDSVLQSVYTALTNTDSTSANIASLVFEANVDVFAVPGLMEHMSSKAYRDKLLERFTLAAANKSITKSLIRDTEEEYTRHPTSFASLPEVMQSFLLMVSGAADIPLTRFLGQSPAGLSSTGEGDMKNYYDRITSIQTLEIQTAMWRLDEALIRSALGNRPDEIFYTWTPLEQLSEKEIAEIGHKNAQTAEAFSRTGIFMPDELRTVVGNQLVEQGLYPGLGELLAENGDLPELDLGEEEVPEEGELEANDAKPRTMYVRRNVTNADEIIKWYKDQGVPEVYAASSLHVTIVYSKKPVDWMRMGQPWEAQIEVPAGGPRLHELFGDQEDVLVLLFKSNELDWRNARAVDIGASNDHGEYQSHISLSLKGQDVDLKALEPWQGPIVLGPETYGEVDLDVDWRSKVEVS